MTLHQSIFHALWATVLLCAMQSCDRFDNFDEPKSMLYGKVTYQDRYIGVRGSGQKVQMQLYQEGFGKKDPIPVNITQDGTFQALLFNGDYKLVTRDKNGPWVNHRDTVYLTTLTEIRLRGHSSRHFEKAPYLLNFVDENGEGRDLEVMGMSAHSDWALYGPYLDKTLIRNYLWYNLSGEIMEWAPNVRYCELILDGEYRGLYLMMETITDGEDCRLDLRDDAYGSSVTGYLLREDRTTEEDLGGIRDPYTYMERSLTVRNDFAIRYPKRSSLTEEMRERIELDYAAFEKALYSYDHDTEDYGYWNFIDEDNFVDYYLINEFSLNIDAGRYSTYLYKDMTGKYKLAVWDFNNACDNYMETETGHSEFLVYDGVWYFMLFKTERFVERVLERYEELRETYFSDEYLMNYIDETLAYLGPAIDRNFEVWGHTFADYRPLIPDERNPDSFEEAVEQLKHWLHERGEFMDESIHTLNQYAHPSRNKTYNH